ncbi:EamA family transporter [Uliginosibacterium sp. 31-16]|uniref:EamA family transporter n=1 Tax=Uliginosibacterium sp. 31-16 TaxID=3068315 RepID=UPI00273E31F2|nr:EamA family transporter [Uliginosibacterium sp. 31-16]MDP5238408.1 EamA family transporter [Uliginosibacterium sp. 31-16]
MLYVLLAACCSVLVSVLLKLARRHDIDVAQAVGWNYLAASVLCWFLFKPQFGSLIEPYAPKLSLLGLGVMLPTLFLVLAVSVRRGGIVLTDIAQRLSLLLSLLAAFLLFGETVSALKLAGLALGLLAVLGILWRPQVAGAAGGAVWPALLAVWAGFALIDVMLKQIAAAGTPFADSLQVSFGIAFVGMALWLGIRAALGRGRLTLRSALAGLLLGAVNFGNILFYVQAHRALSAQPAVVFATMNISVVVLGTLVGVFAFREPLSRLNRAGIALAILAIGLIALGRA